MSPSSWITRTEVIETHPPRTGEQIEITRFRIGDLEVVEFDATAYGGKGGWFTTKGHAVNEKAILHWRPRFPKTVKNVS